MLHINLEPHICKLKLYIYIFFKDKYLHTNCLAALANMSAQFTALHPYVSQRLLSLFETLAKKHARLEAKIRTQAQAISANNTNVNVNLPGNVTANGNATSTNQVANADLVNF